jgi:hypothetical protein
LEQQQQQQHDQWQQQQQWRPSDQPSSVAPAGVPVDGGTSYSPGGGGSDLLGGLEDAASPSYHSSPDGSVDNGPLPDDGATLQDNDGVQAQQYSYLSDLGSGPFGSGGGSRQLQDNDGDDNMYDGLYKVSEAIGDDD